MRWRWTIPLLPISLGVAFALVVANLPSSADGIPILYLRADIATLALLIGGTLSLLAAGVVALWEWGERTRRQHLASVRAKTAEERRRFLQRLDHELKNPLTAIRAGLVNAVDGEATPAQREALSSIEAQVMRLSRLTSDLRKLAELETRPLDLIPVDTAALLQEAVALAQDRPEGAARRLSLTLQQAPWPVPPVLGDWDLLFLAIYNLLDNALKFTRPGDTVEVRAFEAGTYVTIEVADTGPGIPEEELPRVWEELYRGRGARGIAGSGLGLALVRAIVERHGGQITIRSRPRRGTVVTMRLPARDVTGR